MISNFLKRIPFKKFIYILISLIVILFIWSLLVDALIENDDVYSSAPENTEWANVGENKIAYQNINAQKSSDKNVILIGGTTAWSGVWKNTIEDLKSEYNIYAIDMPPFGYSVVSTSYKYDLLSQANTINGFIRSLKLDNVILVAHSYGAGPAMEAVFREQDNYSQFVIIDGAIHVDRERSRFLTPFGKFFSVPTFRYMIVSVAVHLPGFIEASLKYLVYDNDSVDNFWVDIYKRPLGVEDQSRKLARWFHDFVFENGTGLSSETGNYRNLRVPIVIIWGREDNLTPLEQGENLNKIIPNNEFFILNKVGHIPMIDDHKGYINILKTNLR